MFRKPREKTLLEETRDKALSALDNHSVDSEEYKDIVKRVKTLSELIDLERPERLSPNTLVTILGNSVIAVIVVGYESKNVVTTKVMPFLRQLR